MAREVIPARAASEDNRCISWRGKSNYEHDWMPVGMATEADEPEAEVVVRDAVDGFVFLPRQVPVVVRACRDCGAHRTDRLYA